MSKYLREHFGLTQERMASWLGINRVVLAQAEAGQRSIPLKAALQASRLTLATMGQALNGDGSAQPGVLPGLPLPAPDPAPLARRLRECRYQAQRLGHELKGVQARANALENRLKALPALRAYAGPVRNPAREAGWLALFEGEAVDGLRDDCGAGPQRLLAARIAGFEREAELLQEELTTLFPIP